jgi:hypothetical protein
MAGTRGGLKPYLRREPAPRERNLAEIVAWRTGRKMSSWAEAEGRPMRHYHVIENAVGEPHSYRDDVFRSRRRAFGAARERAQWLEAVAGLRVDPLVGAGRYFITTGRYRDAGRLIAVEACEEAGCLLT